MKRTLLSTLVAGALAAGIAVPVGATTFYYNAYGGFIFNSDVNFPYPTIYSNLNVAYANGELAASPEEVWQEVSWGQPLGANQSNLTLNQEGKQPPPPWNAITGHTSPNEVPPLAGYEWINGAVEVSNDFGSVMGWLTHDNNVISQDFIGTVDIHYHLDYYSDPEKTNLVWSAPEMDFRLQIWETPNGANPCADGGANGVGVNINGCADSFSYQVVGATGIGDPFDLPLGSFTYDGTKYVVSSSGFYDAAGTLLGTAWSAEGSSNTFYVNHEVHVPEPASIALMGLGLLGLGVARRRKQLLKA
jgi:hypothetical protein